MSFLISLFTNNRESRARLRRYVEMEYRPSEREAAYIRLLRESDL